MLTRAEFDAACKAVVDHSPAPAGWSWNGHPSILGLGFLSRTVHHFQRPQPPSTDDQHVNQEADDEDHVNQEADDEDEAEAVMKGVPETLVSRQYVVYSPTFRVPTFYFSMHDSMGTPLTLGNLVHTTLFHPMAFEHTEHSTFGITRPESSFPLLSQGEHPTLGIPCWYLHPCATDQAVAELMAETNAADGEDGEIVRLRRWMETWFLVLGTVVNTRGTELR